MKNYVFYTFDSPINDGEVSVSGEIKNPFAIALELVNRGHRVTVVTNKPSSRKIIARTAFKGVEIIYFRDLPLFGILRYLLRSFSFSLVSLVLIPNKNVVKISHSCYASLFIRNIAFVTPHGTNIPEYAAESLKEKRTLLGRLKTVNSTLQGFLDALAMRRAGKVLSVSRFQMKEMFDIYGIPVEKMSLAYNIPLSVCMGLEPLELKRSVDCLFVGRLAEKKGLDLFCSIAEKNKDLSFIIVGGTEYFVTINETLFNRIKATSNIRLVMNVNENELVHFYSISKTLLVTSFGYESLPTVILEAIRYGSIPLAPKSWGNLEVLIDEFLYLESDLDAILSLIKKVLSNLSAYQNKLRELDKVVTKLYENTLKIYE